MDHPVSPNKPHGNHVDKKDITATQSTDTCSLPPALISLPALDSFRSIPSFQEHSIKPLLKPPTRQCSDTIKEAVRRAELPLVYLEYLSTFGIESVDALNLVVDGRHYEKLCSEIPIGHLLMIRIESNKIISEQSHETSQSVVLQDTLEENDSESRNDSNDNDSTSEDDCHSDSTLLVRSKRITSSSRWSKEEEQRLMDIVSKQYQTDIDWQNVTYLLNEENAKSKENISTRSKRAVKERHRIITKKRKKWKRRIDTKLIPNSLPNSLVNSNEKWTKEEEYKLIHYAESKYVSSNGNVAWSKVAGHLNGKSAESAKQKYFRMTRNSNQFPNHDHAVKIEQNNEHRDESSNKEVVQMVDSTDDSDLEILANDIGNGVVDRILEIDDSDENVDGVAMKVMKQRNQTKCPRIDPISQSPIRISWKSSRCGHEFDRENIMQYIRMKENKGEGAVQCPMPGCVQKVSLFDFEEPKL